MDDDGREFLYKARCVLRGDLQTEFIDFNPEELYAPVASHESIRSLLCITAIEDCDVEGCDVDNAYLFGDLDIPIRMKQPTDSSCVIVQPGFDCLLLKSLCGARQAVRIWGNEIHNRLIHWKFIQCSVDPRLYYFSYQSYFIIVCVVVDDIAFASNNPEMMKQFKENMGASFNVKFYGELRSFIRWSITRTPSAYYISQRTYCERLLLRFGMQNCNPAQTPLPHNVDLSPRQIRETPLNPEAHHTFRAIVGAVSYLAHCTRPDILFSILALARSLHAPTFRHLSYAKRILRYIKGTMNYGIKFNRGQRITPDSMRAAVDADWSGCNSTRRSTTAFIFTVNEAP